jgi:hypothetical protein
VLEAVIFPYFDSLNPEQQEEFIFIKHSAKVYKGKARSLRLNKGIKGFTWLPSSPDLNLIKKV